MGLESSINIYLASIVRLDEIVHVEVAVSCACVFTLFNYIC